MLDNSNMWFSNHALLILSRWLAWGASILFLFEQGRLALFVDVVLATGAVNLLISLLSRRFIAFARRNRWLLGLDILYAALVLLSSGGWNSPFILYSYGSLVLPVLLFFWRGAVIGGLSFAAVQAAVLWAFHMSPASMVSEHSAVRLGLMMIAPPFFSCGLAGLYQLWQQLAARHERRKQQQSVGQEPIGRGAQLKSRPIARFNRASDLEPDSGVGEAPLIAAATKTRPAEQSVEDLRRILFTPLPAPNMELAAAIDLLASRFGRHTGVHTHFSLLGRTRIVHVVARQLLIRLAQEAFLNIQQHAHSSKATITLRYDAVSVALMIQDDGVGLLDGTYERPGLHALRAMHYRLSELGGRLDVFETEGGGVTVRAMIPIEQ